MRPLTAEQRRAALVARHHLAGDAADPLAAATSVVALHGTDPASVFLSVLARSSGSSITTVAEQLHDRRVLVRWMAMRRTVFAFARDDIPMVQAAVSTPLAITLRRRLLSLIERNGIDPPEDGDLDGWLTSVAGEVERAIRDRGAATGTEVRADVAALRATIRARTRSQAPLGLTSPLLTVLSTEGRLVRGAPTGAWTTRGQRWEPIERWWPDGLPGLDQELAQAKLAHRWLERFGPATVEDLQWWTGWSKTVTRRALSSIEVEEVDLHGKPGIDLAHRDAVSPVEPHATLLPALDPTPMGWKHRDWFTAVDRRLLYDSAGNIGPTIWWDGELVGGWASTSSGVRARILADRGREAAEAVAAASDELHRRLEGAVVTPAARTPLEQELAS